MKDYSNYNKNKNDRLLKDGFKIYEMQLKGIEGRDIVIKNDNVEIETRACIYNSINPESTSKEDRLLTVRIDTDIKRGSYIVINGEALPFLVLSDVDNHYAYKSCTVRQCNQIIKVSEDISIPCITDGESYGVKISSSDQYLKTSDTKIKCVVARNKLTESLPLNFRFMLENSKHGVYKISDITTYNKNLLTLTCEKTEFIPEYDNLETGICFNEQLPIIPTIPPTEEDPITPTVYTILGKEEIKKSTTQTYSIQPISPLGEFSLLDNNLFVVNKDNASITLQGLTVGVYDTINYVVDNVIVATFDVMVVR